MGNPKSIDTNTRYASMRQIHAAIEHIKRGDFECAITLAGAAEGMLPDTDEPHFRQKMIALEKAMPEVDKKFKGANNFINWLKHGRIVKNGPRYENATIGLLDPLATIYRAITKFEATYDDLSPQMKGYKSWLAVELQTNENLKFD
jgi:hypothetical protein